MDASANEHLIVLSDLKSLIQGICVGEMNIEDITLRIHELFARFVSLDDFESDADLKVAINQFSKIDHLFFSRILINVTGI